MFAFILSSFPILLLIGICFGNQDVKCELLVPKPYTVIRSNQIRLKANPASLPKETGAVTFYASYIEESGNRKRDYEIGEASGQPFEIIWNCGGLSDQSWLYLYFTALDLNKRPLPCEVDTTIIVLDRHPETNQTKIVSLFYTGNIRIDGLKNDWPDTTRHIFYSSDNSVSVRSLWNRTDLFFFIEIKDEYLFCRPALSKQVFPVRNASGNSDSIFDQWNDDNLEISLSFTNSKKSLPGPSDWELLISPDGDFHCIKRIFQTPGNLVKIRTGENILARTVLKGTLNDNTDKDTGYTIEVKIPWAQTGVKPKTNLTIGFDVFNVDIESAHGGKIFSSLSGIKNINNDNPSEWGRLVLSRKKSAFPLIILFVFAALIISIIGFFLKYRKSRTPDSPAIAASKQDHIAIKTMTFIKQNFQNQNLSLSEIARPSGLSENYLSRIFKKKYSLSPVEYLIQTRIEQAKRLLTDKSRTISEIALEVGFGSISNFNISFKKSQGISPKEYRQNH
jgi:AraC-like DNA-binding protein